MGETFDASLREAISKYLDSRPGPSTTYLTEKEIADREVSIAHRHFELGAFLFRVGQMFKAYHEALDVGDVRPIKHFIEDDLCRVLEARIKRVGPCPDGPREIEIRGIVPSYFECVDNMDNWFVSITAHQDGTFPCDLCEYWRLWRETGVATKADLRIDRCPSCGAPVDVENPTRCTYCHTWLANPALDWVVRSVEIQ